MIGASSSSIMIVMLSAMLLVGGTRPPDIGAARAQAGTDHVIVAIRSETDDRIRDVSGFCGFLRIPDLVASICFMALGIPSFFSLFSLGSQRDFIPFPIAIGTLMMCILAYFPVLYYTVTDPDYLEHPIHVRGTIFRKILATIHDARNFWAAISVVVAGFCLLGLLDLWMHADLHPLTLSAIVVFGVLSKCVVFHRFLTKLCAFRRERSSSSSRAGGESATTFEGESAALLLGESATTFAGDSATPLLCESATTFAGESAAPSL